MAKGKKQNLSAEELLEQAILAEDEQPYEVPANWVWTKLENFIDTLSGFSFNSGLFSNKPSDGFPLIRIRDIVRGFTETYTSQECSELYHVNTGDILIGMDGDFNIALWKSEVSLLNQRVCKIKSANDRVLLDKYMFYYLPRQLKEIQDATSSVTVKHLSVKKIKAIALPLPPITEQQRIIDRIESLFAKLDQAKELAQNALDSFETRKAAILHKAFTGELTAKWREGHGLSMDSWKTMSLSKLAYIQTGLAKGKQINSVTTTMPYLRVANVQDGYLDLSEIKLITVEKDKIERYRLKEGDVLFTEGGDYDKLGRGTVWRAEIDICLHQNHVFAVRPEPTVLSSFYLAYLASSRYGKTYFLSCSKQTTNLASINSTQLKAFPVFCPSIIEQQEIVRILDTLIEKEQSAKYKLEPLLDQIDLMKKSILACAFRGELGTNDPSEESALELLKEVVLPQ
ncbi:restriction endonuclease subunit S [Paenibacillus harenae]|uniref:restriction endonuclease subunit S n=1 Tax=Paenibacillus harenae TaxID=306543 RepID=UPI0004030D5C|nr:restriction endonuclease subunit S [Paenibacillus harenae]